MAELLNRPILEQLHQKLVDALLKRIDDGSATASDLSVAAKLLRDNGVYLISSGTKDIHEKLKELLPFQDAEQLYSEDQMIQ